MKSPLTIEIGDTMAKNEKTSKKIASLAAVGLEHPWVLTEDEIREICGSVLTQAPDKPEKKVPKVSKPAKLKRRS